MRTRGLAAALAATLLAVAATGAGLGRLRKVSFDSDPAWEGFNNRVVPRAAPIITQDFGFSETRFAGAEPGEIGGQVWRSTTPAYYADIIRPRTLNHRLTASGTFALVKSSGGSGVFFGWFNNRARGFRPANFLGFRLDGEDWGARVLVEYTTGTWKAHMLPTGLKVQPDGARHAWRLSYDPDAAGGNGAIEFALDRHDAMVLELMPGHKAEGAAFDRFGMLNVQIPGGPMTVYFDDLRYDDKSADFSSDPRWEGKGNRVSFRDLQPDDTQDFGFSMTNFAGGRPGEIGGTFWRVEPDSPNFGYYADRVGHLTLADHLHASGKVGFTLGCADSGMYLGWFNSGMRDQAPTRGDVRLTNFLGILVEGPSRIGHYFRPAYATASGDGATAGEGPVIRPDGRPHAWTLDYDPAANGGNGRVRVTLDAESVTLDLAPGHKVEAAGFDRFGLFTMRRGGHYMSIYFDDLKYTARRTGAGTVRPM